jgi:hypothetical protein
MDVESNKRFINNSEFMDKKCGFLYSILELILRWKVQNFEVNPKLSTWDE